MVRILKRHEHDYGLFAVAMQGPLAAVAAGVSAVATAASTLVGMAGARAEGSAARQAADYKALQQQQQAQESRAASQRSALETRHRADLAQSQLQARAAASGGGASDEGVLDLGEQIAGRGEYQALTDMFKGENAARGFEDAATASIATGRAQETGAKYKATGTLLSGIGSLADKAGKWNFG